jgi:hypothetical protein
MNNAMKKIYADADEMVTFICPNCNKSTRDYADDYKKTKGPILIKCICGNAYEVQIEFRKFYRKTTSLDGLYFRSSHPNDVGRMVVKNLSAEGCGFEKVDLTPLRQGEEIKIEFKLDNLRRSQINKKALVLNVDKHYIGCKFEEPPDSFDPDIGSYLRKT